MEPSEADRQRGAIVVEKLEVLGVQGILVKAARRGYITEASCQVECRCPEELGGKSYFDPMPEDLPDWMPTADHIDLKSEGGKLVVGNVRLAHRLCNRIHYADKHQKPHKKDLDRIEAHRRRAIEHSKLGTPRDVRFPGRRPRIIELVEQLWERNDGMRFGQLVETVLTHDAAALFNMEDDEIEDQLRQALEP